MSTGKRVITYGKCLKSPYVENGLWFVYVPRVLLGAATFFVSAEYAKPSVMDKFGIDSEKWAEIAHAIIPGTDWNPIEGCLWSEMPKYVHILPDGVPILYGISCSQSENYPQRELWYVVIGVDNETPTTWYYDNPYPTFVVDKICTEPEFMNRMGSDEARWRQICWSSPIGIPPWHATLDLVPDPFWVLKRDEASMNRSWFQQLVDKFNSYDH